MVISVDRIFFDSVLISIWCGQVKKGLKLFKKNSRQKFNTVMDTGNVLLLNITEAMLNTGIQQPDL